MTFFRSFAPVINQSLRRGFVVKAGGTFPDIHDCFNNPLSSGGTQFQVLSFQVGSANVPSLSWRQYSTFPKPKKPHSKKFLVLKTWQTEHPPLTAPRPEVRPNGLNAANSNI